MLAKKYERICLNTCVFKKIDVSLHAVSERWKVAGVVERAALEMRCTGNCTGGSNPSLSAEYR